MPLPVPPAGAPIQVAGRDDALPARLVVRDVRPSDEAAIARMLARCSADDLRMRCFGHCRDFAATFAFHLAHAMDSGETALVVVTPTGEVVGVVHTARLPGATGHADTDMIVRSDLKHRGIGSRLMQAMLQRAAATGLRTVAADVLVGNGDMLRLARGFGFRCVAQDRGVMRMETRPRPAVE